MGHVLSRQECSYQGPLAFPVCLSQPGPDCRALPFPSDIPSLFPALPITPGCPWRSEPRGRMGIPGGICVRHQPALALAMPDRLQLLCPGFLSLRKEGRVKEGLQGCSWLAQKENSFSFIFILQKDGRRKPVSPLVPPSLSPSELPQSLHPDPCSHVLAWHSPDPWNAAMAIPLLLHVTGK